MRPKKIVTAVLSTVLLLAIVLIFYIEVPYTIRSHGIVMPLEEWTLTKVGDGNLLSVHKNNLTNSINSFSINEFQRGDAAGFQIKKNINKHNFIRKGDTIGYVNSNELQRKLIALKGELNEQNYLLQVYATGQKPEEIKLARDKVALAKQELKTQQKIFDRIDMLHKDTLIAPKDYELALNALHVKQYNLDIARSHLQALTTGSKEEEISYIKSRINTLEAHIEQLQSRIDSYVIRSPISGQILRQKGGNSDDDHIIKIADMSQMLVVMPVNFYETQYIDYGQQVDLGFNALGSHLQGHIVSVDNTVQMLNRRQSIFITALIDNSTDKLLTNMMVESRIRCDKVSVKEYLKRAIQTIYEN